MSDSKWFLVIIAIVLVMFGCMAFFFTNLTTNPAVSGINNGGSVAVMKEGYQEVTLTALSTGLYDKQVIEVKAGIPVRLMFKAEQYAGCGRQLVIPDFGIQTVVQPGQSQNVEFTPTTPGAYAYRCGMNMFRGTLIVK